MDILNIKKALADNALSVAQYLLPNGVKETSEWRCGSVSGEKGKSLGVHLTGAKAGVWADFQSGEGGDLLDLWRLSRRVSLVEALKEASDWLGLVQPAPSFEQKRSFARPQKPKCAPPRDKVKDYLSEVRNIPGHVLDAYQIGEQGDTIIFPFLLPDGVLAMAKARKAEDGAKPKPTATNCEHVLFGWQAIPANARDVVLTEGEIDALSWAAYGFPAKKQQWIESEFDRMARFERIYLAMDMDKPGDEAALEIASRLGHHRCFRVETPHKDGNACLMEGVAKSVMESAIKKAVPMDPEGLRRPMHFVDDVIHLFWPADGEHVGYRTPYGKLGTKLLFRPAEMTLWSGASGAGKSQVLSDCAVQPGDARRVNAEAHVQTGCRH
jgi:twinkle protein